MSPEREVTPETQLVPDLGDERRQPMPVEPGQHSRSNGGDREPGDEDVCSARVSDEGGREQ
jgi:hypothetical protein